MTTIHIMIDLETWGTTPGSDIRSIGACVFDPLTGKVATMDHTDEINSIGTGSHCFYIACDNPTIDYHRFGEEPTEIFTYPLTRDPRTVQWWSEQSDEAQAAFIDPVDLKDALLRFSNWLCDQVPAPYVPSHGLTAIRLWSHGASFDTPILATAYAAVGLPVPWHYRAPRDTRTAFDMAGVDDHSAWLERFTTGTHHHALDDAICQAKAVCAAYDRVSRWYDDADIFNERSTLPTMPKPGPR